MRDAGNQLSNRGHFLGMDELGLQHGGVGHVGHDHYDAADAAVVSANGAEIHRELAALPICA